MANLDKPARNDTVQILRGLGSLAVMLCHFISAKSNFIAKGPLTEATDLFRLSVEVFFVVSGFIIPYSMYRAGFGLRRDWFTFIAKREIRLAVPYVVVGALTIAMAYAAAKLPGFHGEPPRYTAPQLLSHLGYLTGIFHYEWILAVYWTLALEFQFYLTLMLIYPLLLSRSMTIRIVTVVLYAAPCLYRLPLEAARTWMIPFMGLFGMGIVAFQYRIGKMPAWIAWILLVGMTVATRPARGLEECLTGLITALMMMYVAIPGYRPLLWLGTISYSLYLIHQPLGFRIINFGSRFGQSLPYQLLLVLIASAASLLAAMVLYRFVEEPSFRWSQKLKYGDQKKPPKNAPGEVGGASTPAHSKS